MMLLMQQDGLQLFGIEDVEQRVGDEDRRPNGTRHERLGRTASVEHVHMPAVQVDPPRHPLELALIGNGWSRTPG